MKRNLTPLTTAAEISKLCEKLQSAAHIALDTEFVREYTFFPHVGLIQVATDTEAWLIDTVECSKKSLVPLLKLLQTSEILKIVHAAQADQECMFAAYGITMKPTFDTAVGAEFLGLGANMGLKALLQQFSHIEISKEARRQNWLKRPLSEKMCEYALGDVEYLVALGKNMLEQLERKSLLDKALQTSAKWENSKLYMSDPESYAARLAKSRHFKSRQYATLLRLVAWREQKVRELDVPRRTFVDDRVLLEIALQMPPSPGMLMNIEGLAAAVRAEFGELILQFVNEANKLPKEELPVPPKRYAKKSEAHGPLP